MYSFLGSLVTRALLQVVKETILIKTPYWPLAFIFLLSASYAASRGLQSFSYICEFYYLFLMLFQHSHINVNVAKAVSDIRIDGIGPLIPCIDLENGKIKYVGLAVMKDSKLIDILSPQNTTGILLVEAPKVPMTITLIDPKDSSNTVAFELTKVKKKIKSYYENDEVMMDLSLAVRASVTHQYKIVPQDEKAIEELEEALSENLKNSVEEAIRKSQNDYKVDLFEFIKYF